MGNVEKLRTENQWFSTWYRYHLGSIWVCLKIVYTLQLWSFFLQMMRIHWVLHPTQATGSHVPGSLSLANMVECPVVGTQESVGNGQDVALFRFHMVPCEFSRMILFCLQQICLSWQCEPSICPTFQHSIQVSSTCCATRSGGWDVWSISVSKIVSECTRRWSFQRIRIKYSLILMVWEGFCVFEQSFRKIRNIIWLVVWNMNVIFPIILGMSSSQLTFIFFRGVGIPPTSIYIYIYILIYIIILYYIIVFYYIILYYINVYYINVCYWPY